MTTATPIRPRLCTATLGSAHNASVPTYDRSGPPTIAHLGLGAFARAHLAVYADDLSRLGSPALVRGVSLHSHRLEDQLVPQDCFYCVAEREPDIESPMRVVGSITSVSTGPGAALKALTATGIELVTLSITEKGYDLDATEDPTRPTTASGVIALALAHYRDSGLVPPVIASMDNVLDNGSLLRTLVANIGEQIDPSLSRWILDEVRFPNSVVDRIVPATTDAALQDISSQLGLVDLAAVTTEHHRSWIMAAADGLPPLAEVGVELVRNTEPYQRRKLWLLNGPHSSIAYCGLLVGCETIADAAAHPTVSTFVRRLVDDILEIVRLPAALHAEDFALDALRRFRNVALGHTCVQVAEDGSRKLTQRFLPVVNARHAAGLNTSRFATVVALWIAAASQLSLQGWALPMVDDPAAPQLRAASASGDLRHLANVALAGTFDDSFVEDVANTLDRLRRARAEIIQEQV